MGTSPGGHSVGQLAPFLGGANSAVWRARYHDVPSGTRCGVTLVTPSGVPWGLWGEAGTGGRDAYAVNNAVTQKCRAPDLPPEALGGGSAPALACLRAAVQTTTDEVGHSLGKALPFQVLAIVTARGPPPPSNLLEKVTSKSWIMCSRARSPGLRARHPGF